ncbi:MAG TPA: DMT family transporter [Rudaea sp.]|nr:DMT family transporter [Rudaea sp.]
MDGTSSTLAPPAPTIAAASRTASSLVPSLMFVLVWSSGYVAGKTALAHAGAFSLLAARFAGAALAFGVAAALARPRWLGLRALAPSAVVGLLSLALQFGAIYVGVQWGAEVGVAALVIGAMPLVTAALAPWFGERVGARQWLGLALGLAGVLLVLADRLGFGHASAGAYVLLLLGLVGISLGTLYQKRHASAIDMRLGLAVQHAVAALAMLPFAIGEGFRFDGSSALVASLAWLVAINSIGGFALLFVLLRRGAANRVAQLFFLIPPVTAVLGFALLGEDFTALKLAGFLLAAIGVYLGTRPVAP